MLHIYNIHSWNCEHVPQTDDSNLLSVTSVMSAECSVTITWPVAVSSRWCHDYCHITAWCHAADEVATLITIIMLNTFCLPTRHSAISMLLMGGIKLQRLYNTGLTSVTAPRCFVFCDSSDRATVGCHGGEVRRREFLSTTDLLFNVWCLTIKANLSNSPHAKWK